VGTGYKLSDQFSAWLDVVFHTFGAKSGAINYTLIDLTLSARYRLTSSAFSPYLFAGPGLAYNENRSTTTTSYDVYTGYPYFLVNSSEVDFLAAGGLGMEFRLEDGMNVYLQSKLMVDFTSVNFAQSAFTDSPILYVPIQAGVFFGL
jgi:hypothetical protein